MTPEPRSLRAEQRVIDHPRHVDIDRADVDASADATRALFGDRAYVATRFRELTGETPRAFRERVTSKQPQVARKRPR